MMDITQSNDHAPNTWKALQDGDGRTATLTCANGHVGTLQDHTISTEGEVTPSVVCPFDECGYHEVVRLLEWEESWPCRICQAPVGKTGQHRVGVVVDSNGNDVVVIKHAFCKTHWDAIVEETRP